MEKIARLVSLERMFYKSEGMTLGSGMLPDVHLKILQFGQVLCLWKISLEVLYKETLDESQLSCLQALSVQSKF